MFKVKSVEEVRKIIRDSFKNYPKRSYTLKTVEANNLVLKDGIYATETVPSFHKATVDGYACLYDDVKLASDSGPSLLKLIGEVEMGKETITQIKPGETMYVPTGGMIPINAQCMVMIENTEQLKDEILVFSKTSVNENIITKGSDIKIGDLLIPKNTKINSRIIGALKSQNVNEVNCYNNLTATVISTGDEIVDSVEVLKMGEVRDINTYAIKGYLESNKIDVISTSVIQDKFEDYKEAIYKGLESSDIVFTSGSSSVGEKDYTSRILEDLGAEILVHGMNIKPGKPTIIASYKGKLFVGLPGHPMSAMIVLHSLLDEIINTLFETKLILDKQYIEAILDENISNNTGRLFVQLVSLYKDNELYAKPIHSKSSMISVLQRADGYALIPSTSEGIYKGEKVKIYKLGD